MRFLGSIVLVVMLAASAIGQTIFVRTNEVSGNAWPSEEITGVSGAFRFTLYSTDGWVPATNVTSAKLVLVDLRDNKTTTNTATVIDSTNAAFRAESTIGPGPYNVQFFTYPVSADPICIYWSSLTVTSAPTAASGGGGTITAEVSVSVGNLAELWEIHGDGALAPATDRNIAPHSPSNSALGTLLEPFGEANVRTVRVERLEADNIQIVAITGDAAGLTNANASTLFGGTNKVPVGYLPPEALLSGSGTLIYEAAGRQAWTNQSGTVYYPEGAPLHTGQIMRTYSGGETLTNLNADGVGTVITGGVLYVQPPLESYNGARCIDVVPITDPSATWRASLKITRLPVAGTSSYNFRFGLGAMNSTSSYIFANMLDVNSSVTPRSKFILWSSSTSTSPTAPGSTDKVVDGIGAITTPIYLMVDRPAGATTGTCYIGVGSPGDGPVSYGRMGAAAYSAVPSNICVVYQQPTVTFAGTNGANFAVDDLVLEEGFLW